MNTKNLNAHAYCTGFEIYAVLCGALSAERGTSAVNTRLGILAVSTRFATTDFSVASTDKGTAVQQRLNATITSLQSSYPVSVPAHFIVPVNGFLTLGRAPRQVLEAMAQVLPYVDQPRPLRDASEGLRTLIADHSVTIPEIEDGAKAWLNGLYQHFRLEAVSEDHGVLDVVEIKPGAFGLKIDVKKILNALIRRGKKG